jgi:uncharacterized protein YeaO (DUF488 family)
MRHRTQSLRLVAKTSRTMITLKRSYDPVSRTDGTRFLVERLWPGGVSKATLPVAGWLKEAGPSTELRQWFNHDPDRWNEFRRRYFRELDSPSKALRPVVSASRRGTVTPSATHLTCTTAMRSH